MTAPGGKSAYCAGFDLCGKMGIPLSRLHSLQTPLKNPTSPNQNSKTKAAPESSDIQFPQENPPGRIGVISDRRGDDVKSV